MDAVFLRILDLSLVSSYVIVIVSAVRMLLKRQPKIFSYLLWMIVFLRLIWPFSFESAFSLIPRQMQRLSIQTSYPSASSQTGEMILSSVRTVAPVFNASDGVGILSDSSSMWTFSFTVIWMLGIAILFFYSAVSLRKLKQTLREAHSVGDNVYESGRIKTPFVLGCLQPKIYLPAGLSERERKYIVLHEQTHMKRHDPLFKAAAFLILCLHWFNPLVWMAFFQMSEDMELSCDESVLKQMGPEIKKEYSTSLLALATGKKLIGGYPLAFGENNTRERILNILSYKKPAFWIVIASLTGVGILFFGLLSNPKPKEWSVKDYAQQFIEQEIETYEDAEWSNFKITDSKITKLQKLVSFDGILSDTVEIWSFEYRLKPDDIEKVLLAGGMNEVDGWLTEESSGGKPMLVFSYPKGKPQYLGCMRSGENDFSTAAGQETALQMFFERLKLLPSETYEGNHILVKFPLSTGETCQLFLSQPVLQGKKGIWCVERWMDGTGNIYYATPQTNERRGTYYEELQEKVKQGKESLLLDPVQVALAYINGEIGQSVSSEKLSLQYAVKAEDFLEMPESHYIGYISNFKLDEYTKPSFHLDQIEWLTSSDHEKRLKELNIDPQDLENGYYIYNPQNYPMFCQVTEETQYYIVKQSQDGAFEQVSLSEFLKKFGNFQRDTPPFQITEKGGYVQRVSEQYIP